MFGQVYYFSLIRKYVILVGSLFDNINIARTDIANNTTQIVKVPVTFATKDNMIARVQQDPNIAKTSGTPTLPIIAFEFGNISYDSDRKLQTTKRAAYKKDANTFKSQYTPVPYDIEFKVYIFFNNPEDGAKIIENVLPYFTPDWTPKVKLIPEMEEVRDIPIILTSTSYEDQNDPKFKTHRLIIWTLGLKVKGYFYGPINDSPIIKYAKTEYYAYTNNTFSNTQSNNYAFTIEVTPGLTANGYPTSNASLSIDTGEIEADDDYGFVTQRTD